MPKTVKIYSALFFLLMLAFVVDDMTTKKKIDWNPNFESSSKSPFGLFVFKEELASLFSQNTVEIAKKTPYEFFSESFEMDETDHGLEYLSESDDVFLSPEIEDPFFPLTDTILQMSEEVQELKNYIFIANYLDVDEISVNYLLDFVKDGNSVFMSSYHFPETLLDTLQIEMEHETIPKVEIDRQNNFGTIEYVEPIFSMRFANKKFDSKKYNFQKGIDDYFFEETDSISYNILGYQKYSENERINFIKVNFGKGSFLLHTQPFVFTNYNLLKTNNKTYIANIISYLPNQKTIWDDRLAAEQMEIQNPLRYLLSQPALRWAWIISLMGILLFMIFAAKRRQRVIPIIEKLPNSSVEFAKTIGNLYYQEGKPQDIIHKKIVFFLEHIRNNYHLDTQNLNTDFEKRLAVKSNIPLIEIERLIEFIKKINSQKETTEQSLLLLNEMISEFYKNSKLVKPN